MRYDLITSANRLQRSTRKLQERWREASEQWDDSASRNFQQRYLDSIPPQLQLTMSAIHELMRVLDEAAQETRDDG